MNFTEVLKEGLEIFDENLCSKKSNDKEEIYIDVLGTRGESLASSDDSDEMEVSESEELSVIVDSKNTISTEAGLSSKECEDIDIEDVYVDMDAKDSTKSVKSKFVSVNEIMKKSIIKPGFEKLLAVPCETSEKRLKLIRKKIQEKTKGAKWFNMPATEVTDEVKNDLMILQMRSVLDPKHFYKKNDLKVLPKYFQVGKVLDAPADFYSSRIPKKHRRKTMVEELLADSEFKKYNKNRYLEIIEQKARNKAHRHAKRLKRKGKSKK